MNKYTVHYDDSGSIIGAFAGNSAKEILEYIFQRMPHPPEKIRYLPVEDTAIYTDDLGHIIEVRKIDFTWRKRNTHGE